MVTKRLIDIVFSLLGIVLLFLPCCFVAILIRITSHGPIFFIQKRIGLHGKEFKLIKFRTMSDRPLESKKGFDAGDLARITKIGKILRRTKIDELPQLLNVLNGTMSLVGPRPEVQEWTVVYPDKWQIVHSVRPGITDNASIAFRNEELILSQSSNPDYTYRYVILPQKLDLYLKYVENQSLIEDSKIILKTIITVISK